MTSIPFPVLAVDMGDAAWIIIVVLSVLGWFVKAIKEHGANQPPARRANPEKVRTEIESFLEEISGTPSKRPPVKPNSPNRPPAAKASKKPTKPSPQKAKPPAKPAKPGSVLADQHLASANLGAGLRGHVSTFMQPDRVAAEVQQDLKNRIADEVQADLGPSQTSSTAPTIAFTPAHPLVTLLRDPRGVRQAIMLQEILQKPKALRRG